MRGFLYHVMTMTCLNSFESEYSKLCFNIGELSSNLFKNDDVVMKEFEAGMYLSVFYVFKHGENSRLASIKRKIDDYILSSQLVIEDKDVLEFEHPELRNVARVR